METEKDNIAELLRSLPEPWKRLLPAQNSFPEASDYRAAVRILNLLNQQVNDMVLPVLGAIDLTRQTPGIMVALEQELQEKYKKR